MLTAMFSSGETFEKWFAKWRSEADPAKHLADMLPRPTISLDSLLREGE